MMKKRIVIVLCALVLSGCVNIYPDKAKEDLVEDEEIVETKPVEEEEKPTATPEEPVESEPEETPETALTRNEYIRATFLEHGYTAPDESMWIVKEEGPQKIAVIIKENVGRGKPNITKLIFLESGENTVLFLQINNQIIINN